MIKVTRATPELPAQSVSRGKKATKVCRELPAQRVQSDPRDCRDQLVSRVLPVQWARLVPQA